MKQKMVVSAVAVAIVSASFAVLSKLDLGVTDVAMDTLVAADVAWVSLSAGLVMLMTPPLAAL